MKSLYKILHTSCRTGWGGLEKRIFNESVWMAKDGHTIIIAAPKNTPLYIKAKKHGFKVYPVSFKRFSSSRDYRQLKQIFKNEMPDVVNTHGERDSRIALTAAHRTNVPCRIFSYPFCALEKTSLLKKYIYKKISTCIYTHSDDISNGLKNAYHIKALKVFKIPAGITPPSKEMVPEDAAKKILIEKFSLEPDARFIRVVTHPQEQLDHDTLITGLKKIEARLPNHHIVVTGLNGTNCNLKQRYKKCMAFAQKNNLAHKFHLFTEKGNHWLLSNAFDCQITSVLPDKNNLTEDIIHPLLMSMVCNCPVISDSNPVDDTFIDNETGLLFEPNNPSDLANKILMSINRKDETKKQVAAAYKKVVENHQMRASCEYILKLYQIFKIKSDTPHWNNH